MFVIAGKYYRQKIQAPKTDKTRPTASRLRETLFNILQQEVEGSDFLDIFAGSGAIGIEALSRGAKSAAFIEVNKEAYRALKSNLETLKIGKEAELYFGDYVKNLQLLGRQQKQFHLIFADAPYHLLTATETLLKQLSEQNLLNNEGRLFIENDQPFDENAPNFGFFHVNSRKSGKAYLHQFKRTL